MQNKAVRFIVIALVVMVVVFVYQAFKTPSQEDPVMTQEATDTTVMHPQVTIAMQDGQKIVIDLYPEIAPNTVNNFIELVEKGFYDGLIFHRVIPGFMVQGGDPDGLGTGGPGYGIKGEFAKNGFENTLAHTRGVLSMARSNDPDSAGSQFFIMHQDAPHLDGSYAAFGEVVAGLEVVDAIASVERDANDRPLKEQVMEKVVVDRNGYTFDSVIKK